jgi:uncharacterized protein (DUF302 family)
MQTEHISESFRAPIGARTKYLPDVTVHEARARLRHVLQAEGFSIVADHDIGDLLNRRLDANHEPYFVIEACHPKLMQQVLSVAWDGGLLMPTRLCVWRAGNGTAIATMQPPRLAAAIGRVHLMEVAGYIDERLDHVFAGLDGDVAEEPPATAELELDQEERTALRQATRRHIDELTREAAKTESHPLQHELARNIGRLEAIAQKLDVWSAPGR